MHLLLQGIKVYEWAAFNKLGANKPVEAVPPKTDDPATIMYTSGTTGAQKLDSSAPAWHATLKIMCMHVLAYPAACNIWPGTAQVGCAKSWDSLPSCAQILSAYLSAAGKAMVTARV